MASILEITDESFDSEVLEADSPVVVDFGAEWCHPCRQLDPVVEELAQDWDGKVKVVKLDIDANVESAMRFGVMSVPTLLLFVRGEAKERLTGFKPKNAIERKFNPHLGV